MQSHQSLKTLLKHETEYPQRHDIDIRLKMELNTKPGDKKITTKIKTYSTYVMNSHKKPCLA